ncbi:MAG: BamA/TamA family outer membrane protein [Pseudomonadota bacterium]
MKIFRVLFFLYLLMPCLADANPVSFDGLSDTANAIQKPMDLDLFQIDQILSKEKLPDRFSITKENNSYIVSEKNTKPIGSISIESPSDDITNAIDSALNQLIGKTNSYSTRQLIYEKISEKTTEKGFPLAKWTLNLESKEFSDSLSIVIKLGPDCIIKKTSWPEDASQLIKEDEFLGEICDTRLIQARLEAIENRIRELGYDEVRLRFEKIEYLTDKRDGHAIFKGEVGKKSKYRIIDESSGTKFSDLFAESNNRIAPRFIAPDAVSNELIRIYRGLGYNEITISGPVESREEDTVIWTWRLNAGPKTTIGKIHFDGLTAMTKEKAEEFFASGPVGKLGSYSMEEFNRGLENLSANYRKLGYLDVKIREPRISKSSAASSAEAILYVDEGLPWIISKINVVGNKQIATQQIEEIINLHLGEPYDKTVLSDIQSRLKNRYFSMGFAHAEVRVAIDETRQRKNIATTLNFIIEEGPLVKIGRIAIIGLGISKIKVVERELEFATGDHWNPDEVEISRKKIVALGIFKTVNIVASDPNAYTEKREILDISILLKEAKPGVVSFGPGYDIRKGFRYAAEGSYNNLFGLARQLSIRGGFSEEKQQEAVGNSTLIGRKIGVGYVEPWIFDLPIAARVSASHRATASSFWQFNNRLETELSWKLSKFLDTNFAVFIRNEMNKDVGSEPKKKLYLAEGNTRKGVAGYRITYDGRDSLSFPTKGVYLGFENEVADYKVGGEYKYHKNDLNCSFYLGILPELVYAIGFNWSGYWSVDRKNASSGYDILPASDRLLAGGGDYVKGFDKQLGPYLSFNTVNASTGQAEIDKEVIGGTTRFVFKQEFRVKTSEEGAIALQVDAGNTWSSAEEQKKFAARFAKSEDSKDTKLYANYPIEIADVINNPTSISRSSYWSTGFSYSYLTPVGALRFGWALPIYEPGRCRESSDTCYLRANQNPRWYRKGQFDLSVGSRF